MIRTLLLTSVLGACLSTTVQPPSSVTDIPEEIERGEDVTTNNSSIPTTPFANDPMEQNDFYNPTRKPPSQQTSAKSVTATTTTEKVVTEAEERLHSTTIEAEEVEAEEARPVYSSVTSAPNIYPMYEYSVTTVPDYSWLWWHLFKK